MWKRRHVNSAGDSARRPRRWGVAGALGAVALAWGATAAVGSLMAPTPLAAPAGPPAGALTLPDLDEDGAPERLWVAATPLGPAVRLRATNHGGHDHDVLVVRDLPAGAFVGPAGGPWTLAEPAGRPRLEARLLRPMAGRAPELVVLAGGHAKRYVHLERGFLKLDAREVVPGFSAGLVMLGDARGTLTQLGGQPAPGGAWSLPLTPPVAYTLGFDAAGRVDRITTRADTLTTRAGIGVGDAAAALASPLPGRRVGAEWRSSRYGMIARIGQDERVAELVIARPWRGEVPSD